MDVLSDLKVGLGYLLYIQCVLCVRV